MLLTIDEKYCSLVPVRSSKSISSEFVEIKFYSKYIAIIQIIEYNKKQEIVIKGRINEVVKKERFKWDTFI